jgi:DNA-binding transcriptional MerR regulator
MNKGKGAGMTGTERSAASQAANDGSRTYTITQLAEEFGVTPRAIRFYEDKDLLHPRRQGQMRIYAPRDRARLMLILRGKRVGFSLVEIKEMLDLYDLRDGQEAQLRVALAKFRERIRSLEQQRQDIDDAIRELDTGCKTIERILAEKAEESATAAAAESARGRLVGYGVNTAS